MSIPSARAHEERGDGDGFQNDMYVPSYRRRRSRRAGDLEGGRQSPSGNIRLSAVATIVTFTPMELNRKISGVPWMMPAAVAQDPWPGAGRRARTRR
jgi:hypothetical protein